MAEDSLPLSTSYRWTRPWCPTVASVFPPSRKTPLSAPPVTLRSCRCLPDVASHSLTVPSRPHVATVLLSGEHAPYSAQLVWPFRTWRVLNAGTSQTRAVMSLLVESSVLPSGEAETLRTQSVWPSSVLVFLPSLTCQTLSVLSRLAVTTCFESGEKTMPLTDAVWPFSSSLTSPVLGS